MPFKLGRNIVLEIFNNFKILHFITINNINTVFKSCNINKISEISFRLAIAAVHRSKPYN